MDPDELLRRVVGSESAAWEALLRQVAPQIDSIVRGHTAMRGRALTGPDDVADIRTAVFERLARDEYKNLRRYLEQRTNERPQSFDSWLYGAVDFCIRDHLRTRFGRAPKVTDLEHGPRASKRQLNTQAEPLDEEAFLSSLQHALGLTTKLNMAKIFEYIVAHFNEQEQLAMRLHYADDKSFAEIATLLGLDGEKDAEKLVRRLNARLRHRFAQAPA